LQILYAAPANKAPRIPNTTAMTVTAIKRIDSRNPWVFLADPKHSRNKHQPLYKVAGKKVNEHRYWQAAHRAKKEGSHNTKRQSIT
jgi:hypothetical protein